MGRFGRSRVNAGAQCVHQVDDIALGIVHWDVRQRYLLALNLLLNRRFNALLELIDVLIGIKALGPKLINELLRKLEFRVGYLGRLQAQFLKLTNLGLEMQLMHGESIVNRLDHHNVLLASGGPAPDCALRGFAKRRSK